MDAEQRGIKDGFHHENFKELIKVAKNLTEKSKDILPVFVKVQGKLKDIATETMKAMDANAKVSINSLKNAIYTRNFPDPEIVDVKEEPEKTFPFVINWIVHLLKDVLEKLDEHGDILRVHSEALVDPKVVIDVVKSEEIDAIKEVNEKLRVDLDETRQRGMKGNIIVSSPVRGTNPTCMTPQQRTGQGEKGMESDTEMVLRLIKEKTNITIPIEDVYACHPMGKREKNTYVVRILNRKPGSGWEALTACMMKASSMDKQKNVFINYQLTKNRAALDKLVR